MNSQLIFIIQKDIPKGMLKNSKKIVIKNLLV